MQPAAPAALLLPAIVLTTTITPSSAPKSIVPCGIRLTNNTVYVVGLDSKSRPVLCDGCDSAFPVAYSRFMVESLAATIAACARAIKLIVCFFPLSLSFFSHIFSQPGVLNDESTRLVKQCRELMRRLVDVRKLFGRAKKEDNVDPLVRLFVRPDPSPMCGTLATDVKEIMDAHIWPDTLIFDELRGHAPVGFRLGVWFKNCIYPMGRTDNVNAIVNFLCMSFLYTHKCHSFEFGQMLRAMHSSEFGNWISFVAI